MKSICLIITMFIFIFLFVFIARYNVERINAIDERIRFLLDKKTVIIVTEKQIQRRLAIFESRIDRLTEKYVIANLEFQSLCLQFASLSVSLNKK